MLASGSVMPDAGHENAPREALRKLVQDLLYEKNAISNAYDSLMNLVHRDSGGDDVMVHVAHVLRGLAALLRFIFERLYQHMLKAYIGFAHESRASECSECHESMTALRDTLTSLSRLDGMRRGSTPRHSIITEKEKAGFKPTRYVFAVSSLYDWETQCDIVKLVTRGLNRTAVILQQCKTDAEGSVALQFGCNILVSPQAPTSVILAYVTREQLLQYVHNRMGGVFDLVTTQVTTDAEYEVDDELDELLHRLDERVYGSSLLVGDLGCDTSLSPTAVVPRNTLRGADSANERQHSTDAGGDVMARNNSLGEGRELCCQVAKRPHLESFVASPLPFDLTGSSEELSQVIQYRRDSPPRTLAQTMDTMEECALDPEKWSFQISNSLKGLKSEIVAAIRGLGGHVDNSSSYNPKTTHLVVAEGLTERTEKYMGFCAALKYIVPPRYVFESAKRGRWIVGRLREYDRNPLRHHWASPFTLPFSGWRVALFTSTYVVQSGIVAVLQAGGCTQIASFVFDNALEPAIDYAQIDASSHWLVECCELSPSGYFRLPSWFPLKLRRRDPRFFSLELLHHILCFCTSPLFDEEGRFVNGQSLPLSCRLELDGTS